MKIKPFFTFLFLIFIVFQSCKKDEITDDEYEIINLLTSKISKPIPPPPPLPHSITMKMGEKEYEKFLENEMRKDSIENSKKKFHIYFKDSLTGIEKDFKYKIFEKIRGFEDFYLKEIDEDLMKAKKIDLAKIHFPKNIVLDKNYIGDFTKWNDDFISNYSISRIIFNKNKDKAVVEFNSSNGGSKIYLSKVKGKWKIIEVFGSWVS
ncbi:MAG: hypothetical protein KUL74_00935 [Cloacibacterium sp.]|nr:hypothetical protein [Cloacibacterium sp.]